MRTHEKKSEAVVDALLRLIRNAQRSSTPDDFLRGDIRALVSATVSLSVDVMADVMGIIVGTALGVSSKERK